MQRETPGVTVDDLTPREREVVILIGRERLSYKAAARLMSHTYLSGSTISPETVRRYAKEVRAKIGSELAPRDALSRFYWMHRDAFGDAA